MTDSAVYLVTKEIAQRSGLIQERYRIADGRFVLNNKDLSRVRLTSDEYISGLQGVEKTTQEMAKSLISQNSYQMGSDLEAQLGRLDTYDTETRVEESQTTIQSE